MTNETPALPWEGVIAELTARLERAEKIIAAFTEIKCQHPWSKTTATIVGDHGPFMVHADGMTSGCRIELKCECGEKRT